MQHISIKKPSYCEVGKDTLHKVVDDSPVRQHPFFLFMHMKTL